MSRTPIDPRLVHTKEKSERVSALLETLQSIFRPHVLPLVAPRVEQEMRSPSPLTLEERLDIAEHLSDFVVDDGDEASEELEKQKAALRDVLTNPPPFTEEMIAEEAKDNVDNDTATLVSSWLSVLHFAPAGEHPEDRTLDAATLDDAMFPAPLDPDLAERFDMSFAQGYLTPDEARGILRAVRAALPAGKRLPDEAIEILAQWYISVT